MHRRTTVPVVALATMAVLAGCGSSKKAAETTTTPPTSAAVATSAAPASSAAAGCTLPADPAHAGTAADAATTAGVTTAYTTFFDGKSTTAAKVKYLQNAAAMATLLVKLQQTQGAAAAKLSVKVHSASVLSTGCAVVTFDLLSSGSTLVPGTHGLAVQENGTWKVADETLCGLAAQAITGTLPGCS